MVGAYLAHAPSNVIESVGGYGLDLGIAFQIIDDILDFTGDSKRTGKQIGVDLREGHLTLPSLLAMKDSGPTKKAILEVIAQDEPDKKQVEECVGMVLKSGAIQKAKGMASTMGSRP